MHDETARVLAAWLYLAVAELCHSVEWCVVGRLAIVSGVLGWGHVVMASRRDKLAAWVLARVERRRITQGLRCNHRVPLREWLLLNIVIHGRDLRTSTLISGPK